MVERDPALVPGPTAGQWQGRARLVFAATIGLLLVTLGALGFGWRPPLPVLIVPAGLVVAGLVAWFVLGEKALRAMRIESAAGYSTTLDVAGVDLRHPRTGALERSAAEPPVVAKPESMIARMLRVPRGTFVDRMIRDPKD
jgi:hypothetical protein